MVIVDRAHTDTSQKNVLVTSIAVLTLRTMLKAENWHSANDKPSGHSCMDQHQSNEWRSSNWSERCARVPSYLTYSWTSQHFLSLKLQRGKWSEKPKFDLPIFLHFQWTRLGGKRDPIGLKLGTCPSYGHMYSQLQVQLTYINFYREWKMIATFTFVHDCNVECWTHLQQQ